MSNIEGGIFFVLPTLESGCLADFNIDLVVSVADLLQLIAEFSCVGSCNTDLNNDNAVNVEDLLIFLIAFGSQC